MVLLDQARQERNHWQMAKSCCSSSAMPRTQSVLAELVEQREQFVAFVRGQVSSAVHAEDIVQAAFARAAERADQIETPEAARAWFFRLLRNAVIDDRRRRGVRDRVASDFHAEQSETLDPVERESQTCQCVSRLAAALKPEYAEALRSVEVDEKTVKEFAADTGISAGNAGVRVFRAREALRRAVHETCGTCADGGGCFDCSCGHQTQP
jgi:RNA polymerase sigma factor (sigma-70 family)